MLDKARIALQRHFGFSAFREGQEKIISNIIEGKDALGIMPTGGGKSICYQIPALLLPGTTLVISPLISLMKDQVDALESTGIAATFINSSLTFAEVEQRIVKASMGHYKLLYIAPERLEAENFLSLLKTLSISLIAIDEAHCISQWGHDFRPSYRSISRLIHELPQRPVIGAFTATATPEVVEDIVELLAMNNTNVHMTGFDRENLTFTVVRGENKKDFLLKYIAERSEQAGIIYAATRKEVDAIYEFLRKKGAKVGKYHAGLSDAERIDSQDKFLFDDLRIMVASNAFGMGIDKSNVRYVIHHNMPRNMEAYYQEAGRAGRDGEPSECTLLFSPQDTQIQKFLIEQSITSPERKSQEYKKLQGMVEYCHTPRCLRKVILAYFGEQTDEREDCGNCSNCNEDIELTDITLEAQKVFSCIYRMRERYGASLVAQVLRASRNKKVLQFGFDRLPTYGVLKEYSEKQITDLIQVLIAEGYISTSEGQYPVLKLQSIASDVLKNEAKVYQRIRLDKPQMNTNDPLFEQLRELRKSIAQQQRVPPYIIFPDSTLREMSEACPTDRQSMLAIKGVGEVKFQKYGTLFLDFFQQTAGR